MSTRRMRPALGTFVEVVIDQVQFTAAAFDAAFTAIEQVQQWFSFHSATSLLSYINTHPMQWCELPPAAYRLLRLAHHLTLRSAQRFDCSVGALVVAKGGLPAPTSSASQCRAEGAFLQFGKNRVRLLQPVWLVLDGIAKGYAVDMAVQALQAHGVQHGWVNAGGDIRAFGDASPEVVIRHRAKQVGHLRLYRAALATSAVEATNAYPAILLADAQPLTNGCFSVVASSCWRADALTKVAAACPDAEIDAELARFSALRVPLNIPLS